MRTEPATGGAVTVSEIDVLPVRDCESVMVTGRLFAPAVRSVAVPASTVLGLAEPVPEGFVGTSTVSEIEVFAVRACASAIETGRLFAPSAVFAATVALKEKTLSPA